MRGVRIAVFAVIGFLGCVVLSLIFTVDPAPRDDSADLDNRPGTPPPVVPGPPPMPGSQVAQPDPPDPPAKKRPAPARVAKAESSVTAPQDAAQAEAQPHIWRGETEAALSAELAPSAAVAESASVERPKGPVIVVPHERPKQENRGMRWIKSVGRALGIGARPSPEDQAFRIN